MQDRNNVGEHVKVIRYYTGVLKLEEIIFPHIQNIVEKIANDNNSEFDYN